jgi:hypothetical protein
MTRTRLTLAHVGLCAALWACAPNSPLPEPIKSAPDINAVQSTPTPSSTSPVVQTKPSFDAQCDSVVAANYPPDWRDSGPGDVQMLADFGRSWGRIYYQWHIVRGGQGCLLLRKPYPAPLSKPDITTFFVSEAMFDEITTTLSYAKVKAQLTNCVEAVRDGPYGELAFYGTRTKAKIRWNGGDICANSREFSDAQKGVLDKLQALPPSNAIPAISTQPK